MIRAGIVLVNSTCELRQTHSKPILRLALDWAARATIQDDLEFSARLLDSNGAVLSQLDQVPVHSTYSTTAWVPGEVVRDVYDLPLPGPHLPPGYQVQIILYRAANGQELGRLTLP